MGELVNFVDLIDGSHPGVECLLKTRRRVAYFEHYEAQKAAQKPAVELHNELNREQ